MRTESSGYAVVKGRNLAWRDVLPPTKKQQKEAKPKLPKHPSARAYAAQRTRKAAVREAAVQTLMAADPTLSRKQACVLWRRRSKSPAREAAVEALMATDPTLSRKQACIWWLRQRRAAERGQRVDYISAAERTTTE